MKKAVVFEAPRTGYGIDQVRDAMTVGQLIEFLSQFDEDDLFILSHDNGYTYGSISECYMREMYKTKDEEWKEAYA